MYLRVPNHDELQLADVVKRPSIKEPKKDDKMNQSKKKELMSPPKFAQPLSAVVTHGMRCSSDRSLYIQSPNFFNKTTFVCVLLVAINE